MNVEKLMNKFFWGKKNSQECLHKKCPECNGTGTKKNGQICVHMISCPCSRCSPYSLHSGLLMTSFNLSCHN